MLWKKIVCILFVWCFLTTAYAKEDDSDEITENVAVSAKSQDAIGDMLLQ